MSLWQVGCDSHGAQVCLLQRWAKYSWINQTRGIPEAVHMTRCWSCVAELLECEVLHLPTTNITPRRLIQWCIHLLWKQWWWVMSLLQHETIHGNYWNTNKWRIPPLTRRNPYFAHGFLWLTTGTLYVQMCSFELPANAVSNETVSFNLHTWNQVCNVSKGVEL